ncbi:MAG: restriction endonuclease subunit S [Cyanobacteria bacterium P01_G01_bin.38]
MSKLTEYELTQIFPVSIPGEWGSEPVNEGNALVLRAADFTKDCKLRALVGVPRNISRLKLDNRILHDGDILIEKSGGSPDQPVGRVIFFDRGNEARNYIPSNFLQLLRVAEGLDQKFSYYLMAFLYSEGRVYRYQQQTTGIINLKLESYLKEKVFIPSNLVQKYIQNILSTIDHAIATTEALIEKYQKIKAGLMHDLFTRGIGADGKLRPPRNQAPELYQESEIGWIPQDWEFKAFQYGLNASPKNGYSPKEVETWQGVYVLGLGCLTKNGFIPIQLKKAPRNSLKSGARLEEGDFLISRSNTQELVGLCGIYRDIGHDAIYPDLIMRLKLHQNLSAEFLEQYLLSPAVRQRISAIAVGTSGSMVKINSKTIKSLKIIYPDFGEQIKVVEKLQPVITQLDCLCTQLEKLKKQKSGLMHDLLTGKVSVNIEPDEVAHD